MAAKSAKSTSSARRKARAASAERADKSLDQFRNALERSVTLSRERIEEVMDDAVKRGRMTRDDANELVARLLDRGRKQTEDLLSEVESTLKQFRDEIQTRAGKARDAAADVIERAGAGSGKKPKRRAKAGGRAKTASKPKKATKARTSGSGKAKKSGSSKAKTSGSSNPIAGYDSLSAADTRKAIGRLSASELRRVRAAESRGKKRKTVLADIDKRLAG